MRLLRQGAVPVEGRGDSLTGRTTETAGGQPKVWPKRVVNEFLYSHSLPIVDPEKATRGRGCSGRAPASSQIERDSRQPVGRRSARRAFEAEQAATAGQLNQLAELLPAMEGEFERVKAAMQSPVVS